MKRRLPFPNLFCLLLAGLTATGCIHLGPRPVTMHSMLEEMTDTNAPARWPEPAYTVKQASSYDRGAKTAADAKGWFANADHSQFIRTEKTNGRSEYVLLDADGPGSLVRLWFTCNYTTDTLRIYLDGAAEPAIQGTFKDLLQNFKFVPRPLAIENATTKGQNHPGGMNLFLPIPYARHCKITWSAGSRQSRYYNLEYRVYPAGTKVETYTPAALKKSWTLVGQTARTLIDPPPAQGRVTTSQGFTAAGSSTKIDLPAGPAAVRELELKIDPQPAAQMEKTLREALIQIQFDGQETVSAPVSDFFGSGLGLNTLHNWYRTVEKDGTLICRWTMPYQKSARITLANKSTEPLRVQFKAVTGPWKWDDRSLYFHANWRQEKGIPTRPYKDWNYVTITGKGVYLGDSLALFNPVKGWWGEGDEKIYQDGETFPSHFGTGSEDYYGYAWSSPLLFQGPFSNQVRMDGPSTQGNDVVSRVRDLDRLPFTSGLRFDMEIWHWENVKVDYAVTTYWYGAPGTRSNVPALAVAAANP